MNELPGIPSGMDTTLEQVIARDHYERLRDKLVTLQSAPQEDAVAIDVIIDALGAAQRAYQATHGLIGNHRADDPFRA